MKPAALITQALKNVRRQKMRSALTIFAVVIGATSVTIMLALVTGAKSFFNSQLAANGTLQQIAISQKADLTNFGDVNNGGGGCDSCTKLTDALVTKVLAIPHVIGVARTTRAGAFESITYEGQRKSLNQIVAFDANGILVDNVLAGRSIADTDTAGVVTVTSDYADAWGFKGNYVGLVGKQVSLLSRNWYNGVGAVIPNPSEFQNGNGGGGNNQPQQSPTTLTATIVGVTDASSQSQSVRAPMAWVRQMEEQRRYDQTDADRAAQQAAQTACQGRPGPCGNMQPHFTLVTTDYLATNGYDSLTAKVDDAKNAAGAVGDIKKLNVGAADARSFINQQLTIFNIVGLVLGAIGGIALLVASIGVVNTMVMAILERTREIGVLRACGATKATIRRLFTLEAATLGFWGGVFGVGLGYAMTVVANIFINRQLTKSGVKARDVIALPVWLILAVIGTTSVIGTLAGLYPACRAARLNPIDALRYE